MIRAPASDPPDRIAETLAVAADRLGEHAAGVLSRLGGQLGHVAREAHAQRLRLDAATRKRRGAETAALARAPVPAGLRAVHPSWIEHVLSGLPERARTAVSAPTADPVDVWLARWATANVPPMTETVLPPVAETNDAAVVVDWLGRIGADQMAFALGEQARAIPALAAAIVRIALPPRAGQLGPQRAAIARCRDVSLDDALSFVLVGCRALAPHLAAELLAALQLVLRLPRPIGSVVARELALHAATSVEQCPSWAAMSAR